MSQHTVHSLPFFSRVLHFRSTVFAAKNEQLHLSQLSLYFAQDDSQAGLSLRISHGSVRTLQLLAKPFLPFTPVVHPYKFSH